ncbi:Y-family DNA polymerase [Marinilactibacillus psychrotolerans]|uniref:Y-family DNA polymerase n=1 Tax=Marinilactibacillus psychrotolerans TaxID=191770 RepID=UPI0038887BC4
MKKIKRIDYSNEPSRDLLCIDVKSFFASVEAVERGIHPLESMIAVVSKPNIQGGLILASSPKVKERYGINTGSRVFELPYKSDIQVVEPRMSLYLDKNMEIMRIFKQFVATEDLYPYSIDEAFLDVTASKRLFGHPHEIALKIQKEIWNKLGLIVTIGIGDNPLLAKLCLDHQAKKDQKNSFIGEWRYRDVPQTVWKIRPLSEFWGIGSRREAAFERMGITTIFKLSQSDPTRLKAIMGVLGGTILFPCSWY